jgi:lipopolysaccharide transport system ATP-binding protein
MKPSTLHSAPSTESQGTDLPDDVVLSVRGVSKKFCRNLRRSMWYGLRDLGRNSVGLGAEGGSDVGGSNLGDDAQALDGQLPHLRRDEFWAVKDVSFDLRRGEVLGLIGHNGSGKTSLLRVLTGVFPPDAGTVVARGRIGALIALGAGFHPHLTGRENVFLNGSILGVNQKEIADQLEDIIDFAGIGEFIDAPVATYSSGMRVRLGFAVATAMKPDILLIDEVLAVGDASFQNKCVNRIDEVMKNAAVIFVSHQMANVSRVSTKAILMNRGIATPEGPVGEVIDMYYSQSTGSIPTFRGENDVDIGSVALREDEKELIKYTAESDIPIRYLHDLTIRFRAVVPKQYRTPQFYMAIYGNGQQAIGEAFQPDSVVYLNDTGVLDVEIKIPRLLFSKGIYFITLAVMAGDGIKCLLRCQNIAHFRVSSERTCHTPLAFDAVFSSIE